MLYTREEILRALDQIDRIKEYQKQRRESQRRMVDMINCLMKRQQQQQMAKEAAIYARMR